MKNGLCVVCLLREATGSGLCSPCDNDRRRTTARGAKKKPALTKE